MGASPVFDFENPELNVWTTSLFLGPEQELQVVLDTATDLVAINGEDCKTCMGPKFNMSAAYPEFTLSKAPIEVQYESSTITGRAATGKVCLND